jgi:GDP-L-fucose synthase
MMGKILVTGGSGMVGNALKNIIPDAIFVSSRDYNLLEQKQAEKMFEIHRPTAVIHLAARVGGVKANYDMLGTFFTENVRINVNVLDAARKYNVKKLVSLLSTCVYPAAATYPLTEKQINGGEPHYTNFAYAYAKRMLDVQSRALRKQYGCNFITAIPNNLFGENDYFDLKNSHVIPAIVRKVYEAKISNTTPVFWGDGTPRREFTYSQDIGEILLFLLENYNEKVPINIGNTQEFSILEVVEIISELLEYEGEIGWDKSKMSGQFRKPSENRKFIDLGWERQNYTDFRVALKKTCEWFVNSYPNIRGVNG